MAFAASLSVLQAQASCPICLDYMSDPVTTECGHNFCCCCIQQCWEDLDDVFPCPVCQYHCPSRNLKSNTQLLRMIDIVMQLPATGNERKPLCETHGQVLDFFCEQDLELLCPQCRVSRAHEDHHLVPIEKAAAHHKRILGMDIEWLKEQVEDAEMARDMQPRECDELRSRLNNWRRKAQSKFLSLYCILRREQEEAQVRLVCKEQDVEGMLVENKRRISDHIAAVEDLLSEIAEKCLQTDVDFLRGLRSVNHRYEGLKAPEILPCEIKERCCVLPRLFGLQKMMSTFPVDLTLDPGTAHPDLVVSEDGKAVLLEGRMPPDSSYEHFAVRSCEKFASGRHFWKVHSRGRGQWSLGVCQESFPTDANTAPCPEYGCWQIDEYLPLFEIEDRWIGVFLDYELGEISFFNLSIKSHLYTYTATFTEKVQAYFSILPFSLINITILGEK
ncbi:tripartite motif-containing protein 75-like [Lepus europaeus]|uniref:tripartite motif-containing protein 75-like n=1 Tax=Lepus europaeus TaxID=9983 RepID=UPI002B4AA615|nr:tripartite motif-containing protein 75-like [Lepus europaeus]